MILILSKKISQNEYTNILQDDLELPNSIANRLVDHRNSPLATMKRRQVVEVKIVFKNNRVGGFFSLY